MYTTITESASKELDALLEEICAALQITQIQYEQAVTHYEAVGNWISEDPFLAFAGSTYFPPGFDAPADDSSAMGLHRIRP